MKMLTSPNFARFTAACALAMSCVLVTPAARGQAMRGPPGGHDALAPAADARPAILNNVGIDQKLGAAVPPDLTFRDETGREVRLGQYFGRKPIVLSLVYFECPGLCTVVLNELQRTLNGLSLTAGDQFDVLTVSFDPRETPTLANAKRQEYLKRYGRKQGEAGWHFLTGDAEPIRRLTDAVGFRYAWDERNKQFVHSSGIMVLTPEGRISRYFFGVDYAPTDVKLAIQEASGNRIGSPAERVVLYCFRYDPTTGKYGFLIGRALKVGGILTLISLAAVMWIASKRGRSYAAMVAAEQAQGERADAAAGREPGGTRTL